ncbi:MAG: DUF308 domain-containing protein [Clostridia bacterium]|nr:DUF308 domain-containing protein [Clostridia bacterium]
MSFMDMMNKLKKNWIASAVLCIVVGLILLLLPEKTLKVICYVVGGIATASGVVRMVRYFKQDHTYPVIFQNDLMVGLLSLGLGLFMITAPAAVVGVIPMIFAVVLIGFGIANILRAVDAKKAGVGAWGVMLALAILTVILGFVLLSSPFETMAVTVSVIGGCLIYEGVADIITVLAVGKRIETWRKALNG